MTINNQSSSTSTKNVRDAIWVLDKARPIGLVEKIELKLRSRWIDVWMFYWMFRWKHCQWSSRSSIVGVWLHFPGWFRMFNYHNSVLSSINRQSPWKIPTPPSGSLGPCHCPLISPHSTCVQRPNLWRLRNGFPQAPKEVSRLVGPLLGFTLLLHAISASPVR